MSPARIRRILTAVSRPEPRTSAALGAGHLAAGSDDPRPVELELVATQRPLYVQPNSVRPPAVRTPPHFQQNKRRANWKIGVRPVNSTRAARRPGTPESTQEERMTMTQRDGPRPNILFAFANDWGRYASAYARHQPPAICARLSERPTSTAWPKKASCS